MFTSVVILNNRFAVMQACPERGSRFLSASLEKEFMAARSTAEAFAQEEGIPFKWELGELYPAPLTVAPHYSGSWSISMVYPYGIYSTNESFISEEEAIQHAKELARARKTFYLSKEALKSSSR